MLGKLPEKVHDLVLKSFSRRRIEVVEGSHLKEVGENEIRLTDGKSVPFDFAFLALGIKPTSLFVESGLPAGEDGGFADQQSFIILPFVGIIAARAVGIDKDGVAGLVVG